MSADNGYQHEKAVVMDLISKYRVNPSSYLGQGKESEYLRQVFRMPSFRPFDRNSTPHKRIELSDRLGSGTYQPMKSYANPIYGGIGSYN